MKMLELQFDKQSVEKLQTEITGAMFPGGGFEFVVDRHKLYKKDVVRYNIPFTGDKNLLMCKPSHFVVWTESVSINDNCLCFDIINFYNDPIKIQQRAEGIISLLRSQLKNVKAQVDEFNSTLEAKITDKF